MSVLPALLLVLAVAPPLPAAPRQPAARAPVAQVVAKQGEVKATAGSASFQLTRGVQLDGADVVNLSDGTWVALLILKNGHVVRLDDQLDIAVEKLALFNAGPVKEDAQAQLDRLLSRREKEGLGNERLIGWHQGLAAANTVAAESAKKEARPERQRAKAADDLLAQGESPSGGAVDAPAKTAAPARLPPGSPPAPPAGPPPAPPQAEQAVAVAPPPPPKSRAKLDAGGGRRGGAANELAMSEERKERREPTAAAPRAPLAVDAGLSQCVAGVAAKLEAPVRRALGAKVTLRFRLSDDEVQVGTGGAMPLAPCLTAWAEAHRAQLGPAWAPLVVPLK